MAVFLWGDFRRLLRIPSMILPNTCRKESEWYLKKSHRKSKKNYENFSEFGENWTKYKKNSRCHHFCLADFRGNFKIPSQDSQYNFYTILNSHFNTRLPCRIGRAPKQPRPKRTWWMSQTCLWSCTRMDSCWNKCYSV